MSENTISITRPATKSSVMSTDVSPKYPSEPIGIPSEGYFYPDNSALSSGIIDVKYMTAKEEDILTSQNLIKKGLALDRLLESLIVTPNVKIDELLTGDKNALFVAARRLAYGDIYGPLEIQCGECGETNKKVNVDLSLIKNKEYEFDKYVKGKNSFSFELPKSKKSILFKLLSHKDESDISTELAGLSKVNKSNSFEITTRLKHMIISIDGNSDKATINKFVDNEITSFDSLALRTKYKEILPDVDMEFDFVCENCNHSERMGVPLTAQFFWPKS